MHLLSYLQLSSDVCDVVCDAGTSSLWSLGSHWHTTPSSRYSNSSLFWLLLTILVYTVHKALEYQSVSLHGNGC